MNYLLITGKNPMLNHLLNKNQRNKKKRNLSKLSHLHRFLCKNRRQVHNRILFIKNYRFSCKKEVSEQSPKVKVKLIETKYSKPRRIRKVVRLKNSLDNFTVPLLPLHLCKERGLMRSREKILNN